MNSPIWQQLNEMRTEAGYTMRGLGKAIGVAFEQVWRWENRRVRPTEKSLKKLRTALPGLDMPPGDAQARAATKPGQGSQGATCPREERDE